MDFDAAVFDFDGTLVDSARAKREAFFSIFPKSQAHHEIIEAVLNADPDGSRHRVIPEMLTRMSGAGLDGGGNAQDLAGHYGFMAERLVAEAPELPGASALLADLASRLELHLNSNTPDPVLREHVAARGWAKFFQTVNGHPADKTANVAGILCRGGFAPDRVAVIGDGISDARAAEVNGCVFMPIRQPEDLMAAGMRLGARDV